MKERITPPKSVGDDEYSHKDEDYRGVAPKEREPINAPKKMCEQEIDPTGVTVKGNLEELFPKLPPEDDEALLEEIKKQKPEK